MEHSREEQSAGTRTGGLNTEILKGGGVGGGDLSVFPTINNHHPKEPSNICRENREVREKRG